MSVPSLSASEIWKTKLEVLLPAKQNWCKLDKNNTAWALLRAPSGFLFNEYTMDMLDFLLELSCFRIPVYGANRGIWNVQVLTE